MVKFNYEMKLVDLKVLRLASVAKVFSSKMSMAVFLNCKVSIYLDPIAPHLDIQAKISASVRFAHFQQSV